MSIGVGSTGVGVWEMATAERPLHRVPTSYSREEAMAKCQTYNEDLATRPGVEDADETPREAVFEPPDLPDHSTAGEVDRETRDAEV